MQTKVRWFRPAARDEDAVKPRPSLVVDGRLDRAHAGARTVGEEQNLSDPAFASVGGQNGRDMRMPVDANEEVVEKSAPSGRCSCSDVVTSHIDTC